MIHLARWAERGTRADEGITAVKSFTSKEDAAAFAAGKTVRAAADEPARFYAVAVGNPTGIYNDWSDASEAIKGVKGPKYRRFGSRAEAVAYIKEFGNRETIEALGEKADDVDGEKKKDSKKSEDKTADAEDDDDGVLKIYTDGSSRSNGQLGARAGFGVFFGQGDPRNVSEPLRGEPQTNQRAELTAIQRALEVAPAEQDVQIITDSQYSINCVTKWAAGWRRNGWTTASGELVKNRDLVQAILDRMEEKGQAGGKTVFKWVKGHAADAGNAAADLLAVKGATMG